MIQGTKPPKATIQATGALATAASEQSVLSISETCRHSLTFQLETLTCPNTAPEETLVTVTWAIWVHL